MNNSALPSLPTNIDWDPTAPTQPIRVARTSRPKKRGSAIFLGLLLGIAISIYLLMPLRTNILILGIDRSPEGSALARTDTMILTTVIPQDATIGMLSIPRDLWVQLPDGQSNRINTAHFFAENIEPGSGPDSAKEVVERNFGVDVHYYVRFQFDEFVAFVDALGGIPIEFQESTAGYSPGDYILNGEQALAFVRDRMGTDDFFRMSHGQLFIKALLGHLIKPANWTRTPAAILSLIAALDTDLPIGLWPRIGFTVLRTGADGLDFRMITREMASGFVTQSGAQVLAPDWSKINPVLLEMFGQ